MAIYCYIKTTPVPIQRTARHIKFLPLGLVTLGFVMIANAIFPFFLYQIRSSRFRSSPIITPVDSFYIDYTKLNNWFPTAPKLPPHPSKITHYSLSIPKLKIDRVVVQIGGEDLAKSLIQYPGTALPGQYGNTVIFGHSVLPQFFNPKNYKTIFSTLPLLREGDEILVDFDGVLYRYVISKMIEASPQDISVLEQQYDSEYLSLITCVPPGTYLRRLVVKARLVNP